ncbi:MAG TPA: SCO family protein [Planctomycetaceae bacterium]|nr:SCO family protein [Planctomycetaceae bacterium]
MSKPAAFFLALMLLFAGGLLIFKADDWLSSTDPNKQSAETVIEDFMPKIHPADYETGKGEPWITDFQLVDQTGEAFASAGLRNQVWVASFFFASCPSTCIQQNQEMQSLHEVWARKGVKFISITCDPENDTPGILNAYSKKFTADTENWKFLTGNSRYINRIGSDKFMLSVGPQTHAESFCAVDKWGNVRGTFNWHEVQDMEQLNALLVTLLRENVEPQEVAAARKRLQEQIDKFVEQQQTEANSDERIDDDRQNNDECENR